ncbi:hypothetical protein ACHQM5_005790 [Ranunculus cassubicifolius]
MEEEQIKLDQWGYPVKTSSDHCISAINSYYNQVLNYGRNRSVILEAQSSDENCVLANILAAHYIASTNPLKSTLYLASAKSKLIS